MLSDGVVCCCDGEATMKQKSSRTFMLMREYSSSKCICMFSGDVCGSVGDLV